MIGDLLAGAWASLPGVTLLFGVLGILAVDMFSRGRPGTGQVVAFGAVMVAMVVAILQREDAWEAPAAWWGSFRLDGLGLWVTVLILLAAALTIIASPQYLAARAAPTGEFYALLLLSAAGLEFLAHAGDLVTIFLSLELASISLYVLVSIVRRDLRANEAALKYFVAGSFASAFLLFGMALLYGMLGTLDLEAMRRLGPGSVPSPGIAELGLLLLLVGAFFKVGAVPFHVWVPDAYEGAPVPVTAYMSTAVKAAGFALVLRLLDVSLGWIGDARWVVSVLALVAASTMILGNVMAVVQTSVKRMLAYSSISHTGYALVGVTAAVAAGAPGMGLAEAPAAAAIFYLFVYLFMTLGAFFFLSYGAGKDAEWERFDEFDGLAAARPWAAAFGALFMFSLAGFPPTAGFAGKFAIFREAVAHGQIALVVVGALTTVVSIYYYLRLVVHLYMRPARPAPAGDPNVVLVLGFCAAMTLLLGLVPSGLLDLAAEAVRRAV